MDVFQLFEGVCPDCGGEVHQTSIGGTAKALSEMNHPEGTVWAEGREVDLGYEFKCEQCSATHYIERYAISGDWA